MQPRIAAYHLKFSIGDITLEIDMDDWYPHTEALQRIGKAVGAGTARELVEKVAIGIQDSSLEGSGCLAVRICRACYPGCCALDENAPI